MSDLEARVGHVERDVSDIKITLARIEAKIDTFATREDLANTKSSLIQWSVGTILATSALVFAILRFLPA